MDLEFLNANPGMVIVAEVPAGNKDALMMVVGILTTNFSMIVGYYYGSSKGSADKDEKAVPPAA